MTNLSWFLNFVRPSFTSEISKKHNLPTLLDLSQLTKEGMYLEMRKDKILFLPSSSKRFQVTHNDVTLHAPSVFTSSQRVPLVIFTFFFVFSRISDIEMKRDSLPKHTNIKNEWNFSIISIYTALFFSWHLDSGLVLFNNNSQKPL